MLTPQQLSTIKQNFDRFDDEEKTQVLNVLSGKEEKPAQVEPDPANQFLLSRVLADDQKAKQDEAAVLALANLAQGRPETTQADSEAVAKLVALAKG